jgi:hypothetical protein
MHQAAVLLKHGLFKNSEDCSSQKANRRSFTEESSVAEPHHFYAAPAPGKNLDAAPAPAPLAPAPAPTLLYSKAKFLKRTKV